VCRSATKSSGKMDARSSGGHGGDGNGGAREGERSLKSGGSASDDDGVIVKMRPWYGRPRPARVWWGVADGPAVRGAHPAGYGADGGNAWPGKTSRSLWARARGEGARLGRRAGVDAEAAGPRAWRAARNARARATSRWRSGPTTCRCALV
jgi:hypothetical protein